MEEFMSDHHLGSSMPGPASFEFTLEETHAMQRAVLKLFALWSLTDEQANKLLGGITPKTYQDWKEGQYGSVQTELAIRMSNLIGIHKSLRILFSDPVRAYGWVKRPNTVFDGLPALEVMLRGRLSDIIAVRHHLSVECDKRF